MVSEITNDMLTIFENNITEYIESLHFVADKTVVSHSCPKKLLDFWVDFTDPNLPKTHLTFLENDSI